MRLLLDEHLPVGLKEMLNFYKYGLDKPSNI